MQTHTNPDKTTVNVPNRAYIHPTAYVDPRAIIEDGVFIGKEATIEQGAHIEPEAFIGRRAVIGNGAYIERGAYIDPGVVIDRGSLILSNVRVTRQGWNGATFRAGSCVATVNDDKLTIGFEVGTISEWLNINWNDAEELGLSWKTYPKYKAFCKFIAQQLEKEE